LNDKNEDFKNKIYLLECENQELKIKVSELEVKIERLNQGDGAPTRKK